MHGVGSGLARLVVASADDLASPSRGALNVPMPSSTHRATSVAARGPATSPNWLLTRQNLRADTLRRMAVLPGRTGDDQIAGEQAALRRVATLVARAVPPAGVFAAVTEEAGRLLCADYATMNRYDPDGARTV